MFENETPVEKYMIGDDNGSFQGDMMAHNAISKCPGDGNQSFTGLPRGNSGMEIAIQCADRRLVVGAAIADLVLVEATKLTQVPTAETIVV